MFELERCGWKTATFQNKMIEADDICAGKRTQVLSKELMSELAGALWTPTDWNVLLQAMPWVWVRGRVPSGMAIAMQAGSG